MITNRFASFVTPVYNRPNEVKRCLDSVAAGGWVHDGKSFESVIVNDASTEPTIKPKLNKWKNKWPYNLTVLHFEDHLERIYGFNAGMNYAQGEWIIHLDSDDAIDPRFKQVFIENVKKHPEARAFNWGGKVIWQNGDITQRPIWKPEFDEAGNIKPFKSGEIFSGGFAFKKELLHEIGYLPMPRKEEATNPYAFGKLFLNRYEELKPLYRLPDGKLKTDIGNPFGQDFAQWYMVTRKVVPVQINDSLHITHVRAN